MLGGGAGGRLSAGAAIVTRVVVYCTAIATLVVLAAVPMEHAALASPLLALGETPILAPAFLFVVVAGIVGYAGLLSILLAIEHGKQILLAKIVFHKGRQNFAQQALCFALRVCSVAFYRLTPNSKNAHSHDKSSYQNAFVH